MNTPLLSGIGAATGRTSRRWLLAAAAGILAFGSAQAQTLNYSIGSATNVLTTYTDLGTNGGAITTANLDDANSGAQIIPFSFSYNGQTFNQYTINTNGLLKLGSTALASAAAYSAGAQDFSGGPLNDAAETNVLFPFNLDLLGSTALGTEYRSAITGTAPNRVLTVQWKNVSDKARATTTGSATTVDSQFSSFSFQVKLYETTNNIEFVYGPATANAAATDNFKYAIVGIKGSGVGSTTVNQLITVTKPSVSVWSAATFLNGVYPAATNAFNFRKSVTPDAGRTLRFSPIQATDAAVSAIYTLGAVSSYTSPVTVQAAITNVGSGATTSRIATLTVSGATTFTATAIVPALAAGSSATVTFASYPVTGSTGTNTVAVSLPSDDAVANNTASVQQTLTTNRLSYTDPSVTSFSGGFGSNTTANVTVYVKYRTNTTPTNVTSIIPTFSGVATTSDNYQAVIMDATGAGGNPGTVLYTSAARVRPLAGGADVIAVPNVAVSGDFYVGVTQLTTTNFGLAYQNESPLRTGTFLYGNTFLDLSTQSGANFRPALDVTLRNPLATRNEALAASLSVAPNPAHNTFTLSVPAGTNLREVQASLINALGQTVQTRQLALSAAASTVDFNVNGLAAGVYSLQLKSGSETVVKRVVVE